MRAHSPIMLTQRSRYALRAMLYLAQTPAGGPPIAMHRIASHANVPRKFLELILADLRDAGLLVSRRGKLGGYHLSKPTHLVSLGETIRIIEGPLALVPCVRRPDYRRCTDCEDEATCAIRPSQIRLRSATAALLTSPSPHDTKRP